MEFIRAVMSAGTVAAFLGTAAVPAGGWGLISPVMGAIVHNIGSVLVVMSSASIAFMSMDQ